jgi:hypothetical protein
LVVMLDHSLAKLDEVGVTQIILRVIGSPSANLEIGCTQSVPDVIHGRQECECRLVFSTTGP